MYDWSVLINRFSVTVDSQWTHCRISSVYFTLWIVCTRPGCVFTQVHALFVCPVHFNLPLGLFKRASEAAVAQTTLATRLLQARDTQKPTDDGSGAANLSVKWSWGGSSYAVEAPWAFSRWQTQDRVHRRGAIQVSACECHVTTDCQVFGVAGTCSKGG